MISFMTFLEKNEVPDFNNCAIVTISAVTGKSEEEVWEVAKNYWKPRLGIKGALIGVIIKKLGKQVDIKFNMNLHPRKPGENFKTKTWNQIKRELDPRKKYVINFKSHVAAWVNGKIVDTACVGDKKKVTEIWEIK